jgi:hypothetical protein
MECWHGLQTLEHITIAQAQAIFSIAGILLSKILQDDHPQLLRQTSTTKDPAQVFILLAKPTYRMII